MKKTLQNRYAVRYEISGAGVLHVRSSEILKTSEAKRQIKALKNIKIAPKAETAEAS